MEEFKKLKKEVKGELKLSVADMTAKEIVKHNSDVLEKIYYIYFKVLTQPFPSKFYRTAMNGILKYVHLINVDMIWSLIMKLIES